MTILKPIVSPIVSPLGGILSDYPRASTPVGPPQNLDDLTSYVPWLAFYDAEHVTIDGGRVAQVADRSGNLNHAIEGTPLRQPIISVTQKNGHDVLEGAGLHGLTSTNAVAITTFDVFSVYKANGSGYIHVHGDGGGYGAYFWPNGNPLIALRRSAAWHMVNGAASYGVWYVLHHRWDGTTHEARLNGVVVATQTPIAGSTETVKIGIGDEATRSGSGFNGYIGCQLVSPGMTTDQALVVTQALATYYGIVI